MDFELKFYNLIIKKLSSIEKTPKGLWEHVPMKWGEGKYGFYYIKHNKK